MNKIDVITFLLHEIKNEKLKDKIYEEEVSKAINKAKGTKYFYWRFLPKHIRPTNKTKIKENYKKIRQLCLELSKEIDNE